MENVNINFIIRSDFTKKNGESPIYLRLTQNQKKKDISINLSVDKKYWDSKKQEIKNAFPEKQKELTIYKNRIQKIYNDALYNEESLNIVDFVEKFNNGSRFFCSEQNKENEIFKKEIIQEFEKYKIPNNGCIGDSQIITTENYINSCKPLKRFVDFASITIAHELIHGLWMDRINL